MESIASYIFDVYKEFHSYLLSEPRLCKHKTLHYHLAELPDYNDPAMQQHYILRYSYAYAYDYKRMFIRSFKQNQNTGTALRILSVGCGKAIDYWSAVKAVEDLKLSCRIEYTGVDICNWQYYPSKRSKDSFYIEHTDIISYLNELSQFNQGYIVFPKSISEFSENDFDILKEILRYKKVTSKRFEILASFRSSQYNCDRDKDRFITLVNEVKKNKNCSLKLYERGFCFRKGEDERIKSLDPTFYYPDQVCDTIKNLHTYCSGYKENHKLCKKECEELLDRQPLKSSREMRYGIAPFVEEVKY